MPARKMSGTSSPLGIEALHDTAAVRPRQLVVASPGVLADHAAPEGLGLDVARQLRDLPPPGKRVEQLPGDLAADALAAVAAQDEELADVPGTVAREVRAVADQHEADERPVDAHQERRELRIGPEPFNDRRVAVEAVVPDGPVVDRGEVVEVQLHEAAHDREILRARRRKLDLHDVML